MDYYPPLVGNREKKMCGAKKRHLTHKSALDERSAHMSQDSTADIRIYECPYCHYFHVGRHRDMP